MADREDFATAVGALIKANREEVLDQLTRENAAERLSSRLAFRTGDITVGVASDSTSDGTTDWVRLWEAHLAEKYPHLRIEHQQWSDASKDYAPVVVVQEGEGEPAFSGLVLHDTFTRSSGLATPDVGGPWTVYNAGNWVLDGATARAAGGVGYLQVDAGGKDMTTETTLTLNTTSTGATQDMRIFQGGQGGVFVQVTVNTSGAATAYVWTRQGGTPALVGSVALASIGVPSGTANAGEIAVRIEGSIQNFTATISRGSEVWTRGFQIGEQDYTDMPSTFQLYPHSATPGIGISEARVSVADRPATYQTLRVLSGTMGGGTMQYQLDNWDAMFSRDVVDPGTPDTPPTQAPATATDTFTRTGALAGSTTDTGEMWQGHASWSTDGAAARNAGQVGAAATLALPGLTEGRWTVALTTTAPSAEETVRLGVRTTGNSVYGVFLGISVKTDGMVTINPYVRTATAGFRTLGALTGHGITAGSSTVQNVPMSISLDGTSVHATAGGASADYQITSGELAELGDKLEMQAASATATSWRVLDMSADYVKTIPGLPGTPPVYGDPLDVMLISHGHNYQNQTPAQYLTALDGFLGVMATRRPSTLPLLVSQNPQFAPAAYPLPHARRQAAVRAFAKERRYGYAPVFEHFSAQPDGGQSWVVADGVHPNTPTTPTPTPGRGSSEWGRVLADATTA